MALNIDTLKTRSLTALIFVAVMLVGLLWNFWSFVILFTVIHWGCWIEYLNIIEKINDDKIEDSFIKKYFAFCGITLMWVLGQHRFWTDFTFTFFHYRVSSKYLLWILLFVGLLIFLFQNKAIKKGTKKTGLLGFLYLSLPFIFLLDLRDEPFLTNENFTLLDYGKVYVCLTILSIWINDTMAYLVGSVIGKTPFSKISPKKTWEGTVGGAILCVGVIAAIAYFTQLINVKDAAIIAALCAIFGTLGDLFESKLKRMANVKDSGSFMPGHGGFLDRFDSLLFAVPAVWIYIKLFL
jgi:phosphatidate cytidylyltransferase